MLISAHVGAARIEPPQVRVEHVVGAPGRRDLVDLLLGVESVGATSGGRRDLGAQRRRGVGGVS